MLTDQTATALPRARTRAPQLTRLAWLAMLLFSLLLAHGLQGESAAGHLDAGVSASLLVHDTESSADHDQREHEDGESEESAHNNCAPGQPDDALPVPSPGTSPAVDHCHVSPHSGIRADIAAPGTRPPGATTVLRI
ncbi:hypothetical protein RFN58_35015 [Streptomyces iakyrus]|uniref:hypothetical protein n=1 Tax=Streptomyces iakyrus TaxID=68219 RepID=UPI0005277350|nr:hypothetical protein [Streptomyces iakyrus]